MCTARSGIALVVGADDAADMVDMGVRQHHRVDIARLDAVASRSLCARQCPAEGLARCAIHEASDIDAVVLSHAHIDHIGARRADASRIPNAQYYISQAVRLLDRRSKLGSPLKDFVVHARKNLLPVRDRRFFKDGRFLPGVAGDGGPGHTVGHHMFMVTSNGKSFAFLGTSPTMRCCCWNGRDGFSYDTDPSSRRSRGSRC